jgi:Family of unknown function (DUF6232)
MLLDTSCVSDYIRLGRFHHANSKLLAEARFSFTATQARFERVAMAKEIVYLNTDDVKVTSSRLVIHGGTTYAMRNVTSVACLTIDPDNRLAIQCIIWGVILTLCLIGLIPLVIGIIMIATAKTQYALAVRTSGGEDQFLVGNDRDDIRDVVRAINKAMAGHG